MSPKQWNPEQMQARRARQRHTASLPKCVCGSIAREGEKYCSRCQEGLEKIDEDQRRNDFLDRLMNSPAIQRILDEEQ